MDKPPNIVPPRIQLFFQHNSMWFSVSKEDFERIKHELAIPGRWLVIDNYWINKENIVGVQFEP